MKKLLLALVVLALGIIIGSALEVLVGGWLAIAILVVVLCIAIWNLRRRENEL